MGGANRSSAFFRWWDKAPQKKSGIGREDGSRCGGRTPKGPAMHPHFIAQIADDHRTDREREAREARDVRRARRARRAKRKRHGQGARTDGAGSLHRRGE